MTSVAPDKLSVAETLQALAAETHRSTRRLNTRTAEEMGRYTLFTVCSITHVMHTVNHSLTQWRSLDELPVDPVGYRSTLTMLITSYEIQSAISTSSGFSSDTLFK